MTQVERRTRSLIAFGVLLCCAVCRRAAPPPAGGSRAAPPAATAATPTSAQLVRSYHGKVEQAHGIRKKLFLQITAATDTPNGIEFKYTLNSPDFRTDDVMNKKPGFVDTNGAIVFAGFKGRAHVSGSDVVLESVGIDGPPYWHIVGHPTVRTP